MTKAEIREVQGVRVHVPPDFCPYGSYRTEGLAKAACAMAEAWDRHKRKWHPVHVEAHTGVDCSWMDVVNVKEHWVIQPGRLAGWGDWHVFILCGFSALCWIAVILYFVVRR